MNILEVNFELSTGLSGPAASVPSLCSALASRGAEVELLTLLPVRAEIDERVTVNAFKAWPVARRFGISCRMLRAMRAASNRVQILHSHSLWKMGAMAPGWVAADRRCKLVVSPRGTLSQRALGFSKWKKRCFWGIQSRTLKKAHCIHATADAEYRDIRRMGFKAPVAIIGNGIPIPSTVELDPASRGHGRKRLLSLSRIHPIKGLPRLLSAWARLESSFPGWELIIAGPDEKGHLDELKEMATSMGLSDVTFAGPAHGEAKEALYGSASLFVLPSYSENFGVAVAEALAHGVPVLTTKGAPWDGLNAMVCGWWVENTEMDIERGLRAALETPVETLHAMGARGRAWMVEEFSTDVVGEKMLKTYQWLLQGGDPPVWVRMD